MEPRAPGPAPLEDRAFLLLVAGVSVLFLWLLRPLAGAVLWGIVIAILFAPLNRALARSMRQRRNLAALTTVVIIVVIVILPLTLITVSLVREAAGLYERIRSGQFDFGRYFQQVYEALPGWAAGLLERFDLADVGAVQQRLSDGLMRSAQFLGAQVIDIGQNTFDFLVSLAVMVYLLFFLLRDGDVLAGRITAAIPLRAEHRRALLEKFAVVIRATVKGNIVVALLQGALGALIFWFLGIHAALLWGVVMAVFSLLPAVGAGLVWLPVAIYLMATGAVWQGIVLIAYGVLVIGLVDNVVRPVLVGQDTKMPDYVILVSTVGGIATFGINGFVIGPVIAALFIAVWDIFSAARRGVPIDPGLR
ncbi:MAG TPA: AI-2E family transporter [Candidatus Tectomicrobia bacterium]|nr:AI-2E family transporter [Candidatus Tectomicrobia bacterium]